MDLQLLEKTWAFQHSKILAPLHYERGTSRSHWAAWVLFSPRSQNQHWVSRSSLSIFSTLCSQYFSLISPYWSHWCQMNFLIFLKISSDAHTKHLRAAMTKSRRWLAPPYGAPRNSLFNFSINNLEELYSGIILGGITWQQNQDSSILNWDYYAELKKKTM